MSKSFVKPPVDEKMIDENGYITTAWKQWILDNWQSMDGLASSGGLSFPSLTTTQRDDDNVIGANAPYGLTIYNEDLDELQTLYQIGWRTIYTT